MANTAKNGINKTHFVPSPHHHHYYSQKMVVAQSAAQRRVACKMHSRRSRARAADRVMHLTTEHTRLVNENARLKVEAAATQLLLAAFARTVAVLETSQCGKCSCEYTHVWAADFVQYA